MDMFTFENRQELAFDTHIQHIKLTEDDSCAPNVRMFTWMCWSRGYQFPSRRGNEQSECVGSSYSTPKNSQQIIIFRMNSVSSEATAGSRTYSVDKSKVLNYFWPMKNAYNCSHDWNEQ